VLSIVCLATPAWADFQAGMDAYLRGDYAPALREWRPLVEQGDADAQYNLRVLYGRGHGVLQDYGRARHWWEKTAAQGNANALYNLGMLYAKGYGVAQDLVQAHKWYSLAAANGYKDAVTFCDELAKQMTPAQIAEAQKWAREWKSTMP
jgi:TPR repeat protein